MDDIRCVTSKIPISLLDLDFPSIWKEQDKSSLCALTSYKVNFKDTITSNFNKGKKDKDCNDNPYL